MREAGKTWMSSPEQLLQETNSIFSVQEEPAACELDRKLYKILCQSIRRKENLYDKILPKLLY